MQYPSSEYLTINQFKSLKKIDNNLSIMHLNIRSLKRNFDNLKVHRSPKQLKCAFILVLGNFSHSFRFLHYFFFILTK